MPMPWPDFCAESGGAGGIQTVASAAARRALGLRGAMCRAEWEEVVTRLKLDFTGKVVVKGPLVKMHFEIPEEERSPLSEDRHPSFHTDATSDKHCIERQIVRE